ncbi:cytidylate kinase family protein [Candidatus Nomurabacteria bacterium]|nr:cytidylate kinase family protein [Candidatus Nomurabacteria bacterium]
MLKEKLGYEYISTGSIFRTMAENEGMSLNDFEQLSDTTDKYDKELDNKTKEYGENNDNFIFDSRLAWHFIPDSFKIKLDCDFDTRTVRIAQREIKDLDKVRDETIHREDLITKRYKNYYGIEDFSNDKNFDLVVDTKVNNAEKVVEIIMKELELRKII